MVVEGIVHRLSGRQRDSLICETRKECKDNRIPIAYLGLVTLSVLKGPRRVRGMICARLSALRLVCPKEVLLPSLLEPPP